MQSSLETFICMLSLNKEVCYKGGNMKHSLLVGIMLFCLVILTFIFLISGCSTQISETTIIPAEDNTILINHFVFEPQELVVAAGTTVTWKHNDNVAHTIISQGLFESEVLTKGDEFQYTFSQAGEYTHYCSIHPSMTGRVVVQ